MFSYRSLAVLPTVCMYFVNCIAFNAVFTLSKLSFYGQLLEQLGVALLSRSTAYFSHFYSLLLLYCGQIND